MKRLLMILFIAAAIGTASAKCSDTLIEKSPDVCCFDTTLNYTANVWSISNFCKRPYFYDGNLCCVKMNQMNWITMISMTIQNGKSYRIIEYINPFDGKTEKTEMKEMKGGIVAPYLIPSTTTTIRPQTATTATQEPPISKIPTIPPIISILAIITIVIFAAVWLLGGRGNEEDTDADTDAPASAN